MKRDSEIDFKLKEISEKGIELWTEGGRLKYRAAYGDVINEYKSFLKTYKKEIISRLELEGKKSNRYDPFPMTKIQQAYALGRHKSFKYGNCSCHIYLELEYNNLDCKKVELVWNKLIDRHHMLRTVFNINGYQSVIEKPNFYNIECHLFKNAEETKKIRNIVRNELSHLVYEINKWPLFRIVITKGKDKDIMHISFEFIIADWSSIYILLSEFEKLYFGTLEELEPLKITFKDYIESLENTKRGMKYLEDKNYWLNRIDSLSNYPQLPIIKGNEYKSSKFKRYKIKLSIDQWKRIVKYSKFYGITPTTTIITAYALALSKRSMNKTFCLNLITSNRVNINPEVNNIVGDFTNNSILNVENIKDISFKEKAINLNKQIFNDLDHSFFTGVDVIRELQKTNIDTLFPYVFTSSIGSLMTNKGPLKGKFNENGITQTSQVFIDCQVMDYIDGLHINLDVRESIFKEETIIDIVETLRKLLYRLSLNKEEWEKNVSENILANQTNQVQNQNYENIENQIGKSNFLVNKETKYQEDMLDINSEMNLGYKHIEIDSFEESYKVELSKKEEEIKIEEKVLEIVKEYIDNELLDSNINLYEVGANSLILVQIATKLNHKIDSSIPFESYLIELLNNPSIISIVKFIVNFKGEDKQDILLKENDCFKYTEGKNKNSIYLIFKDKFSNELLKKISFLDKLSLLFIEKNLNFNQVLKFLQDNISKESKIFIISSDYYIETVIKFALFLLQNGYVTNLISFIESEYELHVDIDFPYIGDVRYLITSQKEVEVDKIRSVLDKFCLGEIRVLRKEDGIKVEDILY